MKIPHEKCHRSRGSSLGEIGLSYPFESYHIVLYPIVTWNFSLSPVLCLHLLIRVFIVYHCNYILC